MKGMDVVIFFFNYVRMGWVIWIGIRLGYFGVSLVDVVFSLV